jgi:hypothetical protein
MRLANARQRLADQGLKLRVRYRPAVTLVIAKSPPPPPTTQPSPPPPTTPARNCHPSYPGACLDPTASDYDCAGGSGNGPKYVQGPVQVRSPDPFDLDSDADGLGCERD